MTERYIVHTTVEAVRFSLGRYWVHFEGSRESLQFGEEKPFEVGDKIKITFEKEPDALPIQPSK